MTALFPIFLKLQGRRVLVVGGGRVAGQKLQSLMYAGATLTVVAPGVSDDLVREHINSGDVRWKPRRFEPADLDGMTLVIAATDDAAVNERIYRSADTLGILCNSSDEPERCHFYYPAVVQRGDLQIAISTNGRSPALAQRIRKELEARYDETYADWLRWLGDVRSLYFRLQIGTKQRLRVLHQIASNSVYERYRSARQHHPGEAQNG